MLFEQLVLGIDAFIWGMLADWVVFAGVYFTLGLDFLSVRAIVFAFRHLFDSFGQSYSKKDGQLSPFMDLVTTSGAVVGMGNLTFTALAIVVAGPGVVVWSCLSAFVGFATRFIETYLTVRYREQNVLGDWVGGPMYYLSRAMPNGLKWMGPMVAFFMIFSAWSSGNLAQVHSLTSSLDKLFGWPIYSTGAVIAASIAVVIAGGLPRVARFNVLLLPWAIAVNIILCSLIILTHFSELPAAVSLIVTEAFNPKAIFGGTIVVVIDTGIRSGVFTNGSGVGSAAVLHAAAAPGDPFKQGLISLMVGAIDLTLVVLTSLIVVMSQSYTTFQSPSYVIWNSFNWGFEGTGVFFFVIAIPMAVTSIASFSIIGERASDYLFGVRRRPLFRIFWIAGIVLGVILPKSSIQMMYAIMSSMVCLPNILGLTILSSSLFPEIRSAFAPEAQNPSLESSI